jgi:Ca2+:H+ antiporter
MSIADGPDRLADETERLLRTEDSGHSHPQPGSNEHPVWIQYSMHAYHTVRAELYTSYIYALLVFVPLGFVAGTLGWDSIMISIFNFIAIIPLSALVSFSADELSKSVGPLVGGLINATFGNAVELIVCHH